MSRIVIAGQPRCGKTTLALGLGRRVGAPVRSTDDLMGKAEWSQVSDIVSTWLDEPGPWVIEGIAAVRALRKWLARNPKTEHGLPFDELYWHRQPKCGTNPGQRAMGKATETIWQEIRREVVRRILAQGPLDAMLHEEEAMP